MSSIPSRVAQSPGGTGPEGSWAMARMASRITSCARFDSICGSGMVLKGRREPRIDVNVNYQAQPGGGARRQNSLCQRSEYTCTGPRSRL